MKNNKENSPMRLWNRFIKIFGIYCKIFAVITQKWEKMEKYLLFNVKYERKRTKI